MKKFYYFSKSNLKFEEIRGFYKKFIFLVLFFAVLVSFFVFGTFMVFNEFINPDSEVKSLKRNNALLKNKFEDLFDKYKQLDENVGKLSQKSLDLRLKANLEKNEEEYGIGGSLFEPLENLNSSEINSFVNDLTKYVDRVSLKIKLEKNNYKEIENKFIENDKLYDVIPAIRPSEGKIDESFGMRKHPILKIYRMHYGIDIITDVGTKVYSPGAGVVTFIGWRGGYGLTLEIEHGFGYRTLYGHLEKTIAKVGQQLKRGDIIALSGNSGRLSSGPHVHYEVTHNGVPIDPMNFIFDDVKLFEIVKK